MQTIILLNDVLIKIFNSFLKRIKKETEKNDRNKYRGKINFIWVQNFVYDDSNETRKKKLVRL